jgi:hypothetical protein
MATKKKTEMAEVVKHGEQLIIPEKISYDVAIQLIQRKKQEEEEVVQLYEVVDGFVWDGALALSKAMAKMFGYANAEAIETMFGKTPPKMISVQTGPNPEDVVMVPWGRFTLPSVEGTITTGTTMKDGLIALQFQAEIKRKYSDIIHELANEARRLVSSESIYRGKAFSIRWRDDDGEKMPLPEPKFLDLSKVDESQLVFSEEVGRAIGTSIFTPIEHSAKCRELKIPLKRGALLSGKYGTGKTLTCYVTASKATRNNWTFLHCQRADELADMVKFAQRYQPCAIFVEDIDRAIHGERTTEMDDVLNIVDGIESKNTEIMVIMTTNHLENINPAMLRPGRLDAIINVLPPDAKAVERLVRLYGGALVPENADLTDVGLKLAGQIPAVIRECVERSKLAAIKLSGGGPLTLTGEALLDAASGMKNQLDLLAKGSEAVSLESKVSTVLGEAVTRGIQARFPSNATKEVAA